MLTRSYDGGLRNIVSRSLECGREEWDAIYDTGSQASRTYLREILSACFVHQLQLLNNLLVLSLLCASRRESLLSRLPQ